MAKQKLSTRKVRDLWRQTGIKFESGMHRGGHFTLRTFDHRHFVMSSTTGEFREETDPLHWTTCPDNIRRSIEFARKRGQDEEVEWLERKRAMWEALGFSTDPDRGNAGEN